VISLLTCLLMGATHAVWPGFLGAGATPVAAETLPRTWSPTEGIAWKAELPGQGQSSPVVWGTLVFVTAVEGPNKEKCHVLAFNLSDGQEAWRYTLESTHPMENSLYISRAAPTPVVDDERIVVFFESGDLVALDHQGGQLWKRSLGEEYGKFKNQFGLSASPVQTEQSVIVLVDDEGPSYLLAVDKRTGENLWKQDRTSRVSWSSPALVSVAGEQQIVVSSAGSVDGYAPETGSLLWSYTDVGGNTATTPIGYADGRFLIAASPGRDGERAEAAKRSNLAMSVRKTETGWKAEPLWITPEATPSWASPIVHRGFAYWVNRVGVVYCFDAESGMLHYAERVAQSNWATPLPAGDHIYFFGKDGMTTVLASGPEFQVLSENQLWDPDSVKPDSQAGANESTEERRRAAAMFSGPTQYGYAVANGRILIRTGDTLYSVGK
jgi:outer membrane protein assembly factor BamB